MSTEEILLKGGKRENEAHFFYVKTDKCKDFQNYCYTI